AIASPCKIHRIGNDRRDTTRPEAHHVLRKSLAQKGKSRDVRHRFYEQRCVLLWKRGEYPSRLRPGPTEALLLRSGGKDAAPRRSPESKPACGQLRSDAPRVTSRTPDT